MSPHRVLARFDFPPSGRAYRESFFDALVREGFARAAASGEAAFTSTFVAASEDQAKGMAMQSIQRARIAALVPLGLVQVLDVRITSGALD